ncbi:unnamed protein product [Thelazia callipaeda]|uniref:Receptor expression-enhancing protein n=1 Tax=Thelazia callipaeda TaxID=103827 RepID=A0A0N5D8P7_THECL|nr:unnamed protein product [Thelazia callipaeda]
MVLQFLSHAASLIVGALYPAFKTFKVIRDGEYSQMNRWLKYWTVYAGFLAADAIGDALLLPYIVPGYLAMKMGFLLWTASPYTDGASLIHQKLVAPVLTLYEQDIDEMLDNMKLLVQRQITKLGSGVLDKLVFVDIFLKYLVSVRQKCFYRVRIGLLPLVTVDRGAINQKFLTNQKASVTVVVEEQEEEEDIILVNGHNGNITAEPEQIESINFIGGDQFANDDVVLSNANVVKNKQRKVSKTKKSEGDSKEASHRNRRVRKNRSISRTR